MRIVTGGEMKNADQYTMDHIGLDGRILMENAGRAAAHSLMEVYAGRKFTVLIGSGNNGGDGFVISRTLLEAGFDVTVCIIPGEDRISGDSGYHKMIFEKSGFVWKQYDREDLKNADIIVDAMLGTGMHGEIREPYLTVIKDITSSGKRVVSIDLPSGVPAAEETVPEYALRADHTIILQQPKLSYYLYPARCHYGDSEVVQIGIPKRAIDETAHSHRFEWTLAHTRKHWLKRSASSHKGSHGKVGIVAGNEMMPGAAAMSAGAAVKSGAGLTMVNTVKSAVPVVASKVTEATFYDRGAPLSGFYKGKDALAVGPGTGTGSASREIVVDLIDNFDGPLLVDADGLAQFRDILPLVRNREAPTVITPHPGEMAKLIDSTPARVNGARFETAEKYARDNGIYVVLKGPFTIVATPHGRTFVNVTGNSGLAKGGTGDALTGMILSFLSRYDDVQAAVSSAVFMHGYTADHMLECGVAASAMTASGIIDHMETTFNLVDNMQDL
ncbi:MAG TPA: NAD(P)H-hydrate dehydratase [Candidatus Salinicoccus stercoripullorum]|uniref:Bifunctional NAD(P)H-hydrate repair enzyme n=1 Tax=Candidatus Salinicoccus stercoripullorum TaxID=2838756 RepID=A0A9D1QEF9_9STAP|nr:NAD(P)H-hydrate dehydratase [Candidatus Salinicoccus stercoripullorum]